MNRSSIPTAVLAALLGASAPSQATQFGIQDARSLAMAGVGVSAADSLGAVSLNPALLATTARDKRFELGVPIVSVRTVDPDKLDDDLDRLALPGQRLRADIGDLNISLAAADIPQSQLDADDVAQRLAEFRSALQQTRDKSLAAEEFVGATVAVPDRSLGVGLQITKRTEYAADYILVPTDQAQLEALSTLAAAYAASGSLADRDALRAAMDINGDGVLDDPSLDSGLRVRGLILDEVSVSFARRLDWLGGIDIGATPKLVRATTIDDEVSAQDSRGEIDLGRGLLQTNDTNFDLGLVKAYDSGYRTGLVIRNVLRKSYPTVRGNRITLKPQARAGISHHGEQATVAFDLDLTENDHSGLGTGTQFAGLGIEFDIGLLQLRAGYRHDLANRYTDAMALGFGIDIAGLKFELGVAGNEEETSAGLTIGITL